jgi:hypothetical protein
MCRVLQKGAQRVGGGFDGEYGARTSRRTRPNPVHGQSAGRGPLAVRSCQYSESDSLYFGELAFTADANGLLPTVLMRFAPEYVRYVLNENFEDAKALFLSPLIAVHDAHLVMLASCGIIPCEDARALRDALDSISETEVRQVTYDGTY